MEKSVPTFSVVYQKKLRNLRYDAIVHCYHLATSDFFELK